ncbi:jerky protein homolog-like [Diabrotica virgifera virgifera]|uniref:DDE-1 domain-containing protein n=1 Tax=Diabrotica virgifera virgifera TaxID=50390 RepID=A0ABM5L2E2_DIAVI|nr:jerky protein homolog-like [Diabrotica virgifera virgifera]
MDQGVISSLKRNYRSAILQKRIEEGNDLKSFWKDFTILDAIYEVRSVWEKTKPLTIVRSWKKIMPDICEDDDFLGFDETDFVVKNITEAIKDVPGGEEMDGENILQWLDCDAEDQGYEQLTDEQIVNKITGGVGEDESESDEEGGSRDQQQTTVSQSAALASVEQLLEYVESQEDAPIADKIVLRNIRSRIKKRCFSVQKQKTVTDYFERK